QAFFSLWTDPQFPLGSPPTSFVRAQITYQDGPVAIKASPDGATESGNTVTITTTAPHSYIPGALVDVEGVGVAGYNGLHLILSPPTLNSFTYTVSQTGLAASGGGGAV